MGVTLFLNALLLKPGQPLFMRYVTVISWTFPKTFSFSYSMLIVAFYTEDFNPRT